jgi:predicted negative regulator of RcsB-dependent stress response
VQLDQAARALADGDAAAAEALLRRAVEQASGAPLADVARLRLARVLFDLGREEDALRELGGVRSSGFRGPAAELKGDIHLARGERALAHEAYVAAGSYVQAGEQRPVLEMKIADTSDASDS